MLIGQSLLLFFVCLSRGEEDPESICPAAGEVSAKRVRKRDDGSRIELVIPGKTGVYTPENVVTVSEAYGAQDDVITISDYSSRGMCEGVIIVGKKNMYSSTIENHSNFIDLSQSTWTSELFGSSSETIWNLEGDRVKFSVLEFSSDGMTAIGLNTEESILLFGDEEAKTMTVFLSMMKLYNKVERKKTYVNPEGRLEMLCDGESMSMWAGVGVFSSSQGEIWGPDFSPGSNPPRLWGAVTATGKASIRVNSTAGAVIGKSYLCFSEIRREPRVFYLGGLVASDNASSYASSYPSTYDGSPCNQSEFTKTLSTKQLPKGCIRSSAIRPIVNPCKAATDFNKRIKSWCDQDEWCKFENHGACAGLSTESWGRNFEEFETKLSRSCTHSAPFSHICSGPSILSGDAHLMTGFCDKIISVQESRLTFAMPPFAVVNPSGGNRKKRAGYCLLICLGIGSIGDGLAAIQSNLDDFRNKANENFKRVEGDINRVIFELNAERARVDQIAEQVMELQSRVNSLKSYLDSFIQYQKGINTQLLSYIKAVELQVMINSHNIQQLQSFLNRGGEVLSTLYNSTYVEDSRGCYQRLDLIDLSFTVTAREYTDFSRVATLATIAPATKLEWLPGINLSSTGLGIGSLVVVIILFLVIATGCYCYCKKRRQSEMLIPKGSPVRLSSRMKLEDSF